VLFAQLKHGAARFSQYAIDIIHDKCEKSVRIYSRFVENPIAVIEGGAETIVKMHKTRICRMYQMTKKMKIMVSFSVKA
jgi:hypothetical protein